MTAGEGSGQQRRESDVHLLEPWSWLWMFIWVGALLLMVWLLVRSPRERGAAEDALAILRARFARGEISKEEFERARDVLLVEPREPSR
ncbi:MAG TPA: SHOCT domain-containing protein [Candidatus Deferrimicrobiaceae bacterium]|nr:SHOCT domain-containing protein [Candidatus Deferrimicrobiaceae bacterium]